MGASSSEALSAAGAAELLEEGVEEAGDVAGRVERALELTTALAEGRLDRQIVLREADALVGLLARLDRDGRTRGAQTRAGSDRAACAARTLARTRAVAAARAPGRGNDRRPRAGSVGEPRAGHLLLAGGDKQGAVSHLEAAHRITEDLGDEASAQVTASNLVVARMAPAVSWTAMAIAGVVALVIAGAIAGILYARDGDDDVTTTTNGTTISGHDDGHLAATATTATASDMDPAGAVRRPNAQPLSSSSSPRAPQSSVQARRPRRGKVRERTDIPRVGGG